MNRISVLAVAGAVATVAMTAGCSSTASNTASPHGSPGTTTSTSASATDTAGTAGTSATGSSTSPAASSSSAPSSAPSSPPVAPTHAAGSTCTATEMPSGTWKLVEGSNGAGHVAADIALQNTSTHSCTVSGYPAISLLASDEHPLPTNVTHFPATVATLTVAPGGWIHSELRYSATIPGEGEPATGACEPAAVHALAQLPGDSAWAKVTLAAPTPVCEKGTLQAKPFTSGPSSPAGG